MKLRSLLISYLYFLIPGTGTLDAGSLSTNDKNLQIVELNKEKIDREQSRIDRIDGAADHFIRFDNPAHSLKANCIYFGLLDSLQMTLECDQLSALDKAVFSQRLHRLVRNINAQNYDRLDHYANTFQFLRQYLMAVRRGTLSRMLVSDIHQSLSSIGFIKHHPEMENFLMRTIFIYPDEVLAAYKDFREQPYARMILNEVVKIAPGTAVRYLNTNTIINKHIRQSEDEVVQLVVDLFDQCGMKCLQYPLLDDLCHERLSDDEIRATVQDQLRYFNRLVDISRRNDKLASYSLDQKLRELSLNYVRQMNNAHGESDRSLRFAPADDMNAADLYSTMVYSRDEIFTSTFNGLYARWKAALKGSTGISFMQKIGFNRFRTFISLCAQFGRLDDFLSTMSPEDQRLILNNFASGLEEQSEDLSSAIEVANVYASVVDPSIRKTIQQAIAQMQTRFKRTKEEGSAVVYDLLLELFSECSNDSENWISDFSNANQITSFTKLPVSALIGNDDRIIQQHFFYDDDDGNASFESFVYQYQNSNWIIEDHLSFIVISSTRGNAISIFANKPKQEEMGQRAIARYFENAALVPSIIVHRGHSYYAGKTISIVNSSVKLLVLGSCGSYHHLSSVMKLSSEVQIVSSRQIGTMKVNNPLLKLINETIRTGDEVDWPMLWNELNQHIQKDDYALEKFRDYVPPHQNLGAALIRAYRKRINQ